MSFYTEGSRCRGSFQTVPAFWTRIAFLLGLEVCLISPRSSYTRILVWRPGPGWAVMACGAGYWRFLYATCSHETGNSLGTGLALLYCGQVSQVVVGTRRAGVLSLVRQIVTTRTIISWRACRIRRNQRHHSTRPARRACFTGCWVTLTSVWIERSGITWYRTCSTGRTIVTSWTSLALFNNGSAFLLSVGTIWTSDGSRGSLWAV